MSATSRRLAAIIPNLVMPVLYCLLILALAAYLLFTQHPAWLAHPQLCMGDCIFYRHIMEQGYYYKDGVRSTTNFFPLFPYLWRWSGLGEASISFVNFLCFITGNYLLFQAFKASVRVKLLSLILGCLVFYMVPFTEGMFYLTACVMLIGIQRKNTGWTLAALTTMCLLRSVSILFVPIWGCLFLLRFLETKNFRRSPPYLGYALWGIIMVSAVFTLFWLKTGEFWAFTKAERVWGTYLRIPQFYFGAWGDDRHMVFAQYAVIICLFSGLFLLKLAWQRWRKVPGSWQPDDATLFSLLYMAANGALPLLLRGGEFSALNRYILSTPFLYLFVRALAQVRFTVQNITILFAIEGFFLLFFWRMYTSPTRLTLFCGFLAASVAVLWLLQSKRGAWVATGFTIATAIGIYLQAIQLVDFVHGVWVG